MHGVRNLAAIATTRKAPPRPPGYGSTIRTTRRAAWDSANRQSLQAFMEQIPYGAASLHTALPFRRSGHFILLYERGWNEL